VSPWATEGSRPRRAGLSVAAVAAAAAEEETGKAMLASAAAEAVAAEEEELAEFLKRCRRTHRR